MIKTVLITNRTPVRGTFVLEHFRDKRLIAVRRVENLVTNAGKALFADLFIGGSGTPPTHIALGTGTTAAAVGDTILETEVYREAATRTVVTITITDDSSQYTKTFAIDATHALTEAGLLNASSSGTLCCRQVYTALPVIDGDSLRGTWRLQH